MTSAENFGVGLILVRNCPKSEFGLYVLGYGVLVLVWSLLAALITAQLPAALAHGSFGLEQRRIRYGELLRTLLLACVAATLLGWLVTLSLNLLNVVVIQDAYYWLLLSAVLPGICLRDFMRRYYFQERAETRALLMDAAALALTIAALGTLAAFHAPHLNSVAAGTLALGGLAVGLWAVRAEGLAIQSIDRKARAGLLLLWKAGRWNIGATLVSWIQNQAYTFFVTAMIGLAGLATANAPRVLLTPITMLSTGLALPLLPRFARQKNNLKNIVSFRSGMTLVALTFGLVGVYVLALWLARDELLPLVLGRRYNDVWPFVVAWAVANLFTNVRVYYSTFLLAKGGFRQLAAANMVSAVLVIAVTGPLIHGLGALGSVCSVALGELVLFMTTWRQCRIVTVGFQTKCNESTPSP